MPRTDTTVGGEQQDALLRESAALMRRLTEALEGQTALARRRAEELAIARAEVRSLRAENARLEREVADLRRRVQGVERLRPARPLLVADALRGPRINGGGT